jgi:hypothetical protein
MNNKEKLASVLAHIKRVEENCNIVANKLMDVNPEFALAISNRGRLHDSSKLTLFEFEHLWTDDKRFKEALALHHKTNSHHPEFYTEDGIYGMSDLDICEYTADCISRAQEFGTDARDWFFNPEKAPKRFGYLNDESMYSKIESFVNLILNKPF